MGIFGECEDNFLVPKVMRKGRVVMDVKIIHVWSHKVVSLLIIIKMFKKKSVRCDHSNGVTLV